MILHQISSVFFFNGLQEAHFKTMHITNFRFSFIITFAISKTEFVYFRCVRKFCMMGRKGDQQKNGLAHRSPDYKKEGLDPGPAPLTTDERIDAKEKMAALGEELPNGSHSTSSTKNANEIDQVQCGKKNKKKSKKSQRKEGKDADEKVRDQTMPCQDSTEVGKSDMHINEVSNKRDEGMPSNEIHLSNNMSSSFGNVPTGQCEEDTLENVEFPETVVFKFIRTFALSLAKASAELVERIKPTFLGLKINTLKARDHLRMKIQNAQPIVFRWIKHFGKIVLLLFMVWLDCTLRGLDSFMRMGTTSFFSIVWCGALSTIAMVGIGKFLMVLAAAAAAGLFLGFVLAVVFTGIAGVIFLWFYGSFWTTGLIIFLGGLAFLLSHDRIALFITSVYSVYCAWSYVGWLGLVLGLNLSFITSDALLFFLRNIINEQRVPNSSSEHTAGMQGQATFYPNESVHASSTETGTPGLQANRSPGVPSTSGSESEMTSEDEVVRLLNCRDHYAALGLSRSDSIDVSVIKREYRKKAMLVHPDKNMGNEKSAEAFKKLQNAYEVLLDSFKRKEYDDELRREELLNYFRKFQNASHETKSRGTSSFARAEFDGEDPMGESRRIACKKCGLFHLWVYTKRAKSRARWCQECKDFHQARDGDGWVEQSSQPLLFGILKKLEAPSAYVCADGKVFDATDWYICQGMRCAVNSHKPTFHVNANVVSKNGHSKGTSSGRGGIPAPNMEETMSEEEFFEWLQNAVQSGMFENFSGGTSESPTGFNYPKGGSGSGTSANNKRKKKGKKQW